MRLFRPLALGALIATALGVAAAGAQAVGTATPSDKPWLRSVRVNVSNFDKSLEFYSKVVGIALAVPSGEEEGFKMAVFTPSGKYSNGESLFVIGHNPKQPVPIDPAAIGWLSFYVPDVDAAVARVKAAGYKVIREADPPSPEGRRRVALVQDPDGYRVELMTFRISPPPP